MREEEPTDLTPGISIEQLSKVYKSSDGTAAVDSLSLNMYEGQITALLGHNGAGKTTTISMLTGALFTTLIQSSSRRLNRDIIFKGFVEPTKGSAVVAGFDTRSDMARIRRTLGYCPQHDVLFDTLTVAEHLYLFAKVHTILLLHVLYGSVFRFVIDSQLLLLLQFKGIKGNDVHGEVTRTLDVLNLTNKRNAQSRTLSGGQKRRLSIGMALVGSSKVITRNCCITTPTNIPGI